MLSVFFMSEIINTPIWKFNRNGSVFKHSAYVDRKTA